MKHCEYLSNNSNCSFTFSTFRIRGLFLDKEFNYLRISVIEDATVYKNNRNDQLNQQPNNNIDSLCSFKQFACIFDAKHCLRHHNSTIYPALCTESFAIWIRCIDVILSNEKQTETKKNKTKIK